MGSNSKLTPVMSAAVVAAYGDVNYEVSAREVTVRALLRRGLVEHRELGSHVLDERGRLVRSHGYVLTGAGIVAAREQEGAGEALEARAGALVGRGQPLWHMHVGALRGDAKDMGLVAAVNVHAAIVNGEAEGHAVERLEGGVLRVGYSWFTPVDSDVWRREQAHSVALEWDAVRTAAIEGVGRGEVVVSRAPEYEGHDELGTAELGGDEFYVLVNGWRVGGSYYCGGESAWGPDGERWASWGVAGLSMRHATREAAERVQVEAWVGKYVAAPRTAPEAVGGRQEESGEVRECRSEDGVTEGLVDAIIGIHRVLALRDLSSPAVQGALSDMFVDPDFAVIEGAWMGEGVEWGEEAPEGVQERPAAVGAAVEPQGGVNGAQGGVERPWLVAGVASAARGAWDAERLAARVVDSTAARYVLSAAPGDRQEISADDALAFVTQLSRCLWQVEHDDNGRVRLVREGRYSWLFEPVRVPVADFVARSQ